MPATEEEKTTIRALEIQVVEINISLGCFRKTGSSAIGYVIAATGPAP